MSTLRDFFAIEAGDCISRIEGLVGVSSAAPVDVAECLRLLRLLRGSAQMAGEDRVHRVARELEAHVRDRGSDSAAWDDALRRVVLEALADLRALVTVEEGEEVRDARAARAIERLRRLSAAAGGATRAENATAPAAAAPDPWLAFAAREVSGLVETLEAGIAVLEQRPGDREPLKNILRRQRALHQSPQLDTLRPVAAAVRAIDEACRLVAHRNLPVQGEWLELFRTARSVLIEASEPLIAGRIPDATTSLSTLQRLRSRLREEGRAVPPSTAPTPTMPGRHPAGSRTAVGGTAASTRQPVAAQVPASGGTRLPGADPSPTVEVVPVESLFYRGEALVRRIQELRPVVERGLAGDAAAREALDELYDLILQVLP